MRHSRVWLAVPVAALFMSAIGCKSEPLTGQTAVPAQYVTEAAWPQSDCSGESAVTLLDQIERAAFDARAAGSLGDVLYIQIITRVAKCRADFLPSPLSVPQHCAKTRAARDAAWAGNWQLCRNELEHGH